MLMKTVNPMLIADMVLMTILIQTVKETFNKIKTLPMAIFKVGVVLRFQSKIKW